MISTIKKTIIRISNRLIRIKTKAIRNTLFFQRKHWIPTILKNSSDFEFSFSWGSPEKTDNPLGNYKTILDTLLIPYIIDKHVLEIGCLDGKWSKYLCERGGMTTLVDLDKAIVPILEDRLQGYNFNFYETKGYELSGIKTNSIDLIFSMDTLVRVPIRFIKRYMKEFKRVLKPEGKILIHLPCIESLGSKSRGFVRLEKATIENMCKTNGFDKYEIDSNTINHGVLLKVNYE